MVSSFWDDHRRQNQNQDDFHRKKRCIRNTPGLPAHPLPSQLRPSFRVAGLRGEWDHVHL